MLLFCIFIITAILCIYGIYDYITALPLGTIAVIFVKQFRHLCDSVNVFALLCEIYKHIIKHSLYFRQILTSIKY